VGLPCHPDCGDDTNGTAGLEMVPEKASVGRVGPMYGTSASNPPHVAMVDVPMVFAGNTGATCRHRLLIGNGYGA